jgi:predicted esterase
MAGPHHGLPVLERGERLDQASAAMVLLHGRGATASDIFIDCEPLLSEPGFAFLAPEAAGDAWYPNRFTEELAANEPWLGSALGTVGGLLERLAPYVPPERVVLLGFSQGACLALEYAARRPRRYGAVVGLSGALIGPPEAPREVRGSLEGTPVFLGCGDADPYIPAELVEAAGDHLRRLGGEANVKIYPGMAHVVSADEIAHIWRLMAALTRRDRLERGRPAADLQRKENRR